jgi:hypothetical protein
MRRTEPATSTRVRKPAETLWRKNRFSHISAGSADAWALSRPSAVSVAPCGCRSNRVPLSSTGGPDRFLIGVGGLSGAVSAGSPIIGGPVLLLDAGDDERGSNVGSA